MHWKERLPRGLRRLYAHARGSIDSARASIEGELLSAIADHPVGEKLLEDVLFQTDGAKIVTADRVDSDALIGLMREHSVCAIHVKGFCPPDIAARLSDDALREYSQWMLQGVATDTFYAGGSIPIAVARSTRADFVRYFREWQAFVDSQRSAAMGQWPTDRLRIALDEAWPEGALLGHVNGLRARPSITRIMFEDAVEAPEAGFVHTDQLDFVLSSNSGVFSANIYLRMPPRGGEFQIWNIRQKRARTPIEFVRQRYVCALLSNAYNFDAQEALREALPPPLTIRPEIGDLILLDTARPHAVARSRGGPRVSIQTFIQHERNAPLRIHS
jgi:hypothetical protein